MTDTLNPDETRMCVPEPETRLNLNDPVFRVMRALLPSEPLVVLRGRVAGESEHSYKIHWRENGVSGIVDIVGKAIVQSCGIGSTPEEAVALYEDVVSERLAARMIAAAKDRARLRAIREWRKECSK